MTLMAALVPTRTAAIVRSSLTFCTRCTPHSLSSRSAILTPKNDCAALAAALCRDYHASSSLASAKKASSSSPKRRRSRRQRSKKDNNPAEERIPGILTPHERTIQDYFDDDFDDQPPLSPAAAQHLQEDPTYFLGRDGLASHWTAPSGSVEEACAPVLQELQQGNAQK